MSEEYLTFLNVLLNALLQTRIFPIRWKMVVGFHGNHLGNHLSSHKMGVPKDVQIGVNIINIVSELLKYISNNYIT